MLDQIVGFFIPMMKKQLVDYVHKNIKDIKDFKFTLDSLERNLKSLSAKASDVEDQIRNAELSGKKKRKREVEIWLTEVKSIETELTEFKKEVERKGFIGRFIGGGRAAQINERVDGLLKQSRHFGELLLVVHDAKGEALLTTRMVGDAFEKNLKRIWRSLVTDMVPSIGIYGMGGAGKTTLAKHVNNQLVERTQECIFWITVSQVFTIEKLQGEIARVARVDLSDEQNEDKRAARLHRAISSLSKKSVLILDDVWENIDIKKVGYPLSVEGHRLIITTCSLEVCRQIGCQEVIAVEKLHMDEAWNLFRERLGIETKLGPQIEGIAMSMAKMCGGLPLGIITLAGSMKGVTEIHVWRNALEELKESLMRHDDMEVEVFKVLKYSFDRLNSNHKRQGQSINGYNSLQRCFLYCSLYPEDYRIGKEELVRKFISEELMDKRESRRALVDQGHSILDKLENVCLLESTGFKSYDNIVEKCVKMHDVVRAMALEIIKGKTIVIAGRRKSLKEIPNEENWTKDVERMSLMKNDIYKIPPEMSPNCPKLSTLLLQDNWSLGNLPDPFFSQMQGLCTLDLSSTHISKLPNSLLDLKSLKTLLLRCCSKLRHVPYMGKLKALRELDLTGTRITEVPQGFEELVNLKFLSIQARYLETFPRGLLLKFPNLQHLSLPYDIDFSMEEIESLKQLEEFRGRVKNVCDFNRFIKSVQSRMHDAFYDIQVGSMPRVGIKYWFYNRVEFSEYNLEKGEEDETMLGQNIQKLIFSSCRGLSNCLLDDFPRLISNLGSLKGLKIDKCRGIKCLLTSEQLMAAEELQTQFSTLEQIELLWLPDFMGVIHKAEIGATVVASTPPRQAVFSSLRELRIDGCNNMKKLGIPISEFPNLEEISVAECDEIEEIIEVGDDERRGEGKANFVSLPRLKVLGLNALPSLKSICKATMICSSIQIVRLERCPVLKKLPLNFVPRPPALREISMLRAKWESLEWEDPTHPRLLQPFLNLIEDEPEWEDESDTEEPN